jgi:hypothetical protein
MQYGSTTKFKVWTDIDFSLSELKGLRRRGVLQRRFARARRFYKNQLARQRRSWNRNILLQEVAENNNLS